MLAEPLEPSEIGCVERLFDPVQIGGFQPLYPRDGLIDRPRLVRVDHERCRAADGFADLGDPLAIFLGIGFAHLQLQRGESIAFHGFTR